LRKNEIGNMKNATKWSWTCNAKFTAKHIKEFFKRSVCRGKMVSGPENKGFLIG
jgi:hypothetical protein